MNKKAELEEQAFQNTQKMKEFCDSFVGNPQYIPGESVPPVPAEGTHDWDEPDIFDSEASKIIGGT